MGEIAASFTENRRWFKDRLISRLRQRVTFWGDYEWNPGMWEPFKHHMSMYLWWDLVVDAPSDGLLCNSLSYCEAFRSRGISGMPRMLCNRQSLHHIKGLVMTFTLGS